MLDIIGEIAEGLGKERDDVEYVVNEFLLQLHKHFFEHERSGNTDFILKDLRNSIPKSAHFNLISFLGELSEKYVVDEEFIPSELANGGISKEWLPYYHQLEGWKDGKK